jgi:hypothetical protein
MTKTEEVLALARKLVALEAAAAAVREQIDALVAAPGASPPARVARAASAQRRAPMPDVGDVQAVVLKLVLAEPERSFRAADLRPMLSGKPGKNSVESALQRLMKGGQIQRAGRGLYQAPRATR